MMRLLLITVLATLVGLLAGCEITPIPNPIDEELPLKGTIDQGNIVLFPKSEYGYVGDPMPFFSDGTMNMFYLLDERGGTFGFHPFALLQTDDFLNWNDIGTVIPYVNSISSQDLALGTGSVVQDQNGLYHAFYTGYNGTGEMPYFEKVQHAISTDLVEWTKLPEDGFYGGVNDFRDPYIYFNEENSEYWMIVTTRNYTGGILKIFKSNDLYNWVDNGVFYDNPDGSYNMECATLIKYNDYYYLSFSEQGVGNDRVVHYRYTDNIENGFVIPENDTFDGWGLYAGRIELFNEKLVLSGWVATKSLNQDYGTYEWGGNLVTHEIIQLPNGELNVKILSEIDEALSNEVQYSIIDENVEIEEDTYTFSSVGGYKFLIFEELIASPTKQTFTIDITNASNFGITLNAYQSSMGNTNVYLDFERNRIEFYTVEVNQISTSAPEITIPYTFDSNTLDITIITEGSVVVVYVNEEMAITSRAYNMVDSYFGYFTLNSEVVLQDLHFYE